MNWQSVQAVHAMLIRRQGVAFGVLVILGDSLEVHESELVCVPALCDDFAPLVQCQGLISKKDSGLFSCAEFASFCCRVVGAGPVFYLPGKVVLFLVFLLLPQVFRQCGLFSVFLVSERHSVIVVPELECCVCRADVHLLFLLAGYGGFIDDLCGLAVAIQRTFRFFPAVTWFFWAFFREVLFVVAADFGCDVGEAGVANFDVVVIEYLF